MLNIDLMSRFYVSIINPLETAGFIKIFHIFADSMGILQILSFILENLPCPCITAIFLNKTGMEIETFSNSIKSFNIFGVGSRAILL